MKLIAFIAVFFFHNVVNSASLSTEDIFSQAEKYTLELEVEITVPFIEDEVGSYGGTGFLIDKKKGWILTNAHVIGRSPSIVRGRFKDNEYHNLKKIYIDPLIDLAVVQIEAAHIPKNALESHLDCVTEPRTGHPVGTYGHPWEVSFTATRGIVSGTTYLQDDIWLQVDAPINQGNSGGPLISLKSGLVIGISSAIGKDTEGLNFALPIKYVCTVINLLNNNKNPSPPNLDIIFFQSDEKKKLKVADVLDSRFDVLAGDTIKSISGKPINHKFELIDILRGKEEVTVVIERQSKIKEIVWTLQPKLPVIGTKGLYFSGMLITHNNLKDRKKNDHLNTWVINSIADGTSSLSHALSVWDFIETIDNQVFSDIESLYSYLSKKENNDDINLVIRRLSLMQDRLYDYYDIDIQMNNLKIVEIE